MAHRSQKATFDDDEDFAEAHEINVTPFIDVMLVLLIIFMVAAPLSTVDLPVDLPSSTATPQKKPDKPTYVRSSPICGGDRRDHGQARRSGAHARCRADASKDRFIFLRADRAVPYGEMMDVLEILRAGGYSKIKLVALEGASNSGSRHRPRQGRQRSAPPAAAALWPGRIEAAFGLGGSRRKAVTLPVTGCGGAATRGTSGGAPAPPISA
jgi:biopolymer transport protein ExbD